MLTYSKGVIELISIALFLFIENISRGFLMNNFFKITKKHHLKKGGTYYDE